MSTNTNIAKTKGVDRANVNVLEAHATLILTLAAGLSLFIYALIFAKIAFLPDLYNVPLLLGQQVTMHSIDQGLGKARAELILAFISLGILYYIAWKAAHYAKDWVEWAIVLTAAFAFGTALLMMYPFGAADIFDNITHARILALYHGNPFAQPIVKFPYDPFIPYTAWKFDVSAYGPIWELAAGLAIKIVGDSMMGSIIAFKLLPALFWLLSLPVVWLILRKLKVKQALPAMVLFAWNPLMLYEVWGNGHNDMMMAFFILLAGYLLLDKQYSLAILSLVAGTLVKYIPILLVPIVGLIALADLKTFWKRASFVAESAVFSALLIYATFKPFWYGIKTLTLSRREGMLSGSAGSAVWSYLVDGLHWPKDPTAHVITLVLLIMTVSFAVYQGFLAMRKPTFQSFVNHSFNVLIFYLLVTVPWFQQWYAIWIVVLLPFLEPMARKLALVFAFSVLGKQLWVDPMLYWERVWSPLPNREIAFAFGNLIIPWLYALHVVHQVWLKRVAVVRSPRRALASFAFAAIPVTGEENHEPQRHEELYPQTPAHAPGAGVNTDIADKSPSLEDHEEVEKEEQRV